MTTSLPRLPTFVVLGTHRAAGRWLRNNLAAHPDVHLPWPTAAHFSERDSGRGVRGYRIQFRDAGDARAVGEVPPNYLTPAADPSAVARRIESTLPDVRLIAVVRQPVDRMVSAHRDHIVHGRISSERRLFDIVRQGHPDVEALDLIGPSLHGANLYPFWRRFGDQLLILFADDLLDDPAKAYDQVLAHLDLPMGFRPPHLERVLYSNAHTRWAAASDLDDVERRSLYMLFRRDVEELEAMTGRYVPSWDPGPPPADWRERLGRSVP